MRIVNGERPAPAPWASGVSARRGDGEGGRAGPPVPRAPSAATGTRRLRDYVFLNVCSVPPAYAGLAHLVLDNIGAKTGAVYLSSLKQRRAQGGVFLNLSI